MSKKKKKSKKKKTGGRTFFKVLLIALLIIGLGAAAMYLAVNGLLKFEKDVMEAFPTQFADVLDPSDPDLPEEVQVQMLTELRASGDLFNVLRSWATNSTRESLMYSKDVINILVAGVDKSAKNSDTIMLVSLNRSTKKIFLSSVMRDSFTYIKAPSGEVGAKINAAYANGGIDCLIATVENDYKIRIDHYVTVDFDSFEHVVDILGGITVPVQQYEMNAMNDIAESKDARLSEYGDAVTLNGKQALLYCRIRKCDKDGDVSRTRRQRQFMTAVIESSRSMSLDQATKMIKMLHGYVKTDCSSNELIGYAGKAIAGKWYDYEIVNATYPLEENRRDYRGNQWAWIVDYPADAIAMQTRIYGKTNITLSKDRYTALDAIK